LTNTEKIQVLLKQQSSCAELCTKHDCTHCSLCEKRAEKILALCKSAWEEEKVK